MIDEDLRAADYLALHEFRFQIGRFLHFSEEAAKAEGLEPRQHQFLLAVKANESGQPTVGEIARRLFIRHHSAVELADRLEERGLAERIRGSDDRRQVHIRLTPDGAEKLRRLSRAHREEMLQAGPLLLDALQQALLRFSSGNCDAA